jgi:hypothetical protein
MLIKNISSSACLSLVLLCAGCAGIDGDKLQQASAGRSVASLRFIGEQRIPLDYPFMGSIVGGLSGIDYDPRTNSWVMESDDRSEVNPARFYSARLDYDSEGFHAVNLTGVTYFRQADGSLYPGVADFSRPGGGHGGEAPDIESIRFDPQDSSIWYSSEGYRKLGMGPFVKQASRDGAYLASLPLAPMFRIVTDQELGPRDNLSFEGLSFSPDGKYLWVGMEAPLYQDGPLASVRSGAMARISKYTRDGKLLGQYAYPVDAIPFAPAGKYADNGVSEILAINDHQLLTLERAGIQNSEGVFKFYIRIYEMDVSEASDISGIASLQGAVYQPAKKHLILNLNESNLPYVDNLEGIAWGPLLANGHNSLVLVSDNNFNATQVTQLLAFEVIPKQAR